MVDLAANLTTGDNSELTQLIQSGDLSGAFQLATAALAAIHNDDAPQTVSQDELREKRIRVTFSFNFLLYCRTILASQDIKSRPCKK